jgi:hypothetical protein
MARAFQFNLSSTNISLLNYAWHVSEKYSSEPAKEAMCYGVTEKEGIC